MKPRSILQLILLSFIWGASFLLIRVADVSFPPLWIALMRSSLGGALLLMVLALQKGSLPARKDLPMLLAVAFFNNVIPFACFAWGEQVVPSNIASVLNATVPIFTLLLAIAITRRRVGAATVVGVVLGFAGVAMAVLRPGSAVPLRGSSLSLHAGVALITCGTLGYAVATTIAKLRLSHLPPITLAASQLSLATLVVAPLALLTGHPEHLSLRTVAAVTVLGCFGSGIAYLLFFNLLQTMPATQTAAVTYLLPIWGIFWGVLAHEHIGMLTIAGVLIAIAGLVLMNLPTRAAQATTLPVTEAAG